jgi:mRNA interferase RelE/StbE
MSHRHKLVPSSAWTDRAEMRDYGVVWETEALSAAHRYLADDPTGIATVFDRVDDLAQSPRPPDARAWAGTHYRLRVGAYRVLYEISDATITVSVINLGRSTSS